MYVFLAVLGLCYCMRAFSSCSEWVLSLVAMPGLFLLWSTGSRAQRLSGYGAWALLLHSTWDPPRSGTEPMSAALAS